LRSLRSLKSTGSVALLRSAKFCRTCQETSGKKDKKRCILNARALSLRMLYTLTEEEFAKMKSDRLALEAKVKAAEIEIGSAWRVRAAEARAAFSKSLVSGLQHSWSFSSSGNFCELKRIVQRAANVFEDVLEGRLSAEEKPETIPGGNQ
jgi:hypothetical protein